jgi:hypothetical protein
MHRIHPSHIPGHSLALHPDAQLWHCPGYGCLYVRAGDHLRFALACPDIASVNPPAVLHSLSVQLCQRSFSTAAQQ